MAGIGDLFGLGGGTQAPTPGLLDAAGYMDPAQYDRMRQSQSMMGLWAGLLAGGGPSLSPRNFGSALGAGLTGAQQFGAQFDEASQHRAAAQKNLADIVAKKQGFQIAQDWINKGGEPSGTPGAAAAPGSGSSTPNFGAGLTGAPGRLASADIYKLATDVGFKGDAAETMTAIIQGESGNRPGAIGDQSIGGSYGLTQINRKAHGDVALEALNNPRRALELAYDISKGGTDFSPWSVYKSGAYKQYLGRTQALADGGAVPDFAGGRSLALPDTLRGTPPVPSVLATPAAPAPTIMMAPGVNPNAQAAPGAGAALTQQQQNAGVAAPISVGGGLAYQPGGRNWAPPVPPQGNGPVNVRQLAGEAAPAETGPSFGYGSAGERISPAVLAAAAGGAPPVPNAMVAPAPPVPAPAPPVTQPPAAAAAPAPGATRPPGGPGEVTVTLPKPPALGEMLPVPAAQPQPLPAAPEIPGVPARPQIPGATAGAAVSPAVAARARQAQGVVLGLSMMGVHVPDFLQKEAGIEIAGRTAAAEAEAKQPIELQNKAFEASLTAAQKRWDALDDQQKQTLAFQRNLTVHQMDAMYANIHEQYKSILGLTTARAMEEQKTAGGAENTQTTMTIGNRKVPMTVAQANRISRGEPPEQVLGPGVLQLGEVANTGQIPEGYQMVPGADGGGPRMEPLPGSPQARALDQKQTTQQQNASVVTQDLRRAQDLVSGGYVTGFYGRGSQLLPGTDRTRFDALVGGIGANFSIDRLQQMRDASPTGGALGQVTEGEHKLLRDSYGSLSPEQGEKQLSENIARVHQRYMDIVNGTPEHLGKMLREGRITKDRYDTLIAQRDLPAGGGAAASTTPGGAIRTPYGTIRPVQ